MITFARSSDINQLIEIENLSFKESFSRRQLLYGINQSKLGIYVNRKGTVITGYLYPVKCGDSLRIYSFAVHPDYRGQGIGSSLIDNIKGRYFLFNKDNYWYPRTIRLEVRKDNHKAIKFYKYKDFRQINIKYHYYQDGTDAIIMEKFNSKD